MLTCPDGNIRVTEEELKRSGRQSVQLADGSGDYLGALGTFHAGLFMRMSLIPLSRCLPPVALPEVYPSLRPWLRHADNKRSRH